MTEHNQADSTIGLTGFTFQKKFVNGVVEENKDMFKSSFSFAFLHLIVKEWDLKVKGLSECTVSRGHIRARLCLCVRVGEWFVLTPP